MYGSAESSAEREQQCADTRRCCSSCTVLGRWRDAALRWTTWSSRRPLCDAAVTTLQQRSSARLHGTGNDRWMNAQPAAC